MQQVKLSAAQRAVIDHVAEHPGIVQAGAGTGKTFTIVERVVALHERGECPADRMLLLTFGRKAAAELRSRIARRLGEAAPDCQTFHAFAWQILLGNLYDTGLSPETTVIEDADARVEFRKAFDEYVRDPQAPDSGFPLRQYNREELRDGLFAVRQQLKEQGISVEVFRDRALAAAKRFGSIRYHELRQPHKVKQGFKKIGDVTDEELRQQIDEEQLRVMAAADVFARFDGRLAQRNALTYADILVRAEAAVRENPELRAQLRDRYRCCIVDEYQDTDRAQHRFLEALFGKDLQNVMVVGDVLQSIYSFRGAHPENVEALKSAPHATTYPLFENRRSFQEILDLAHHVVLPSHADAQPLVGERGTAERQIVHVSSLWADGRGPREYLPFDEARVLEAAAVARRIGHLLASGARVDPGSGVTEPIAPRHIAILSRTKTNVAPVTDALLARGIPFRLVGGVGFYDAPEVRDALAWLRLLADPFDSHAVARALGSPSVGATDAVLAHLSQGLVRDETAFARRALVEDLTADEATGRAARDACLRLRSLLDQLAPHAALPLLGALRAVLEVTHTDNHYRTSADARAPQALANLAKLEALARGFAQGNAGAQPADFVSYIDELERIDFDEREADIPSYDAVTISTIHAAKGLEWPVVFVLGVWPDLRQRARLFIDDQGALLYGEGADGSRPFHYLAVTRGADAEGIVRRVGDPDDESSDKTEERRLFYVAITRARDRIFISGMRGKPSPQDEHGLPRPFLRRVYEWLARRGWEPDEEVPEPLASGPLPRVITPACRTESPAAAHGVQSEVTLAVPLSYSLIAAFEQCPRRAIYRLMFRVPEVGGMQRRLRALRPDEEPEPDLIAEESLLGAGDYGAVLHKALELWAKGKRAGGAGRSCAELVSVAADVLGLSPSRKQSDDAALALEQVERALESWTPVHVEAPFTLDFGDEGRPLLVSGYLDLLAYDAGGRACLVDYKTGGAPEAKFALQLALYRAAAREVYGMKDALCFVGRVKGDGFVLEPIVAASDEQLRRRIASASAGLLARDARPIAGRWCDTCGYRAAPCQDYQRAGPA